jgi:hypothetical protein
LQNNVKILFPISIAFFLRNTHIAAKAIKRGKSSWKRNPPAFGSMYAWADGQDKRSRSRSREKSLPVRRNPSRNERTGSGLNADRISPPGTKTGGYDLPIF